MRVADFDFDLPRDRIAQHPPPDRADARLMILERRTGRIAHAAIGDLVGRLDPGDVLVLNDTRVFPARLRGRRADTGGAVELLLLAPPVVTAAADAGQVLGALLRGGFTPRPGQRLVLADGAIDGTIVAVGERGRVEVRLAAAGGLAAAVDAHGAVPLPPYIRREAGALRSAEDRARYQTVYARHCGAVAAPTAGLHFTPALLEALRQRGVTIVELTLHVGIGTFRPVATAQVANHRMEAEWYRIAAPVAAAIRAAKEAGRRVTAVGTTTVRALETTGGAAGEGWSELFIRPPYAFRCVDALLTNFHLPRSTLLMMVCAFAGRSAVLDAYREAIRSGYRFYSYGDAMLLL